MTNKFFVFVALFMVLFAAGCGGNVENVKILEGEESKIYSEEDIEAAYAEVKDYFKKFGGCTLTELYYPGDDIEEFDKWAKQYNADEAIILLSSFDTDSDIGNGFSPDSTYSNWNWILVRTGERDWEVATYGY